MQLLVQHQGLEGENVFILACLCLQVLLAALGACFKEYGCEEKM